MSTALGVPRPVGTERCAPAAQRRGDPLPGTAAPVSRWLLIEQPGHWGADALSSRFTPDVAGALAGAAAGAGIRILFIRRPGRAAAGAVRSDRGPLRAGSGPVRAWAYVDSRTGRERVRWGSYTDPAELLTAGLTGEHGEPGHGPVYLVCAHGKHDACCAIRGRPVAAALARERPGLVWECSHVGGDRFAANLVVLPEGLCYGHVTAGAASDVVAAYDAGEVHLPLLRGRSSLPAVVQAAQHHARRLLDERRIAALAPRGVSRTGTGEWRVRLAHGAGEVTVSVAAQQTPPARLTCSPGRAAPVTVFRLIGWETGPTG